MTFSDVYQFFHGALNLALFSCFMDVWGIDHPSFRVGPAMRFLCHTPIIVLT